MQRSHRLLDAFGDRHIECPVSSLAYLIQPNTALGADGYGHWNYTLRPDLMTVRK
jgi:hypothetical protein